MQGALGQAFAVGRIQKRQPRRAVLTRRAQLGGVAAEDLADAGQAQSLHVAADAGARLGGLFDEQAIGSPARQRLEAKRAAASEQVEDPGAVEAKRGQAVGEDVEDGLAYAIGGRAHQAARGGRQRSPAKLAADNPHRRAFWWRGRPPRAFAKPWSGSGLSPSLRETWGPNCSMSTRRRTGSTSPGASSSSWKGPNETLISRFTVSPRLSRTVRTSRFLPSRSATVSHTFAPWVLSRLAAMAP